MEEQLLEFAAKALNMDQEEIKESLQTEGGLNELLQKDAARVKAVKDSGFKSAERKINATWEQKLSTTFNIQSDTKGPDLIDEVSEAIESKLSKTEPKEITEAQIKKHPLYLEMERKSQEVEKTVSEKWQKELSAKEEAWQQKEVFNDVKGKGLSIFEGLKPILSDDPARAASQKSIFLRELENFKYMKNGDEILLLDKETGERLNNEQGYPVRFEDVVKKITTQYFDLQAAEPRSSSGRKPDEQPNPALTVPKTKEEYVKILSDTSIDPAEKQKVIDAYHSAN